MIDDAAPGLRGLRVKPLRDDDTFFFVPENCTRVHEYGSPPIVSRRAVRGWYERKGIPSALALGESFPLEQIGMSVPARSDRRKRVTIVAWYTHEDYPDGLIRSAPDPISCAPAEYRTRGGARFGVLPPHNALSSAE